MQDEGVWDRVQKTEPVKALNEHRNYEFTDFITVRNLLNRLTNVNVWKRLYFME